jgi:hypothetical protein
MKMRARFSLISAAALALAQPAAAIELQTMAEAQKALYPNAKLTPVEFKLTADQVSRLRYEFKVPVLRPQVKAWRIENGGWLYLDQVYGLHDIVTYLVAIDDAGKVTGIEVLTCADGFCGLYTPQWRSTFAGKEYGKWQPSQAVPMVSGATLSSRHVAEGVKKILAIHALYAPK